MSAFMKTSELKDFLLSGRTYLKDPQLLPLAIKGRTDGDITTQGRTAVKKRWASASYHEMKKALNSTFKQEVKRFDPITT